VPSQHSSQPGKQLNS